MQEIEKMTERQVAKLINVTPKTLLNWRKKGLIPSNLFEVKKYMEGNIRVFYFKGRFLEWYKLK